MPVHLVCECGNELFVPAAEAGTEHRCTRCGRRLFTNEADAEADFDSRFSLKNQSEEETQIQNFHGITPIAPAADEDPDVTWVPSSPGLTAVGSDVAATIAITPEQKNAESAADDDTFEIGSPKREPNLDPAQTMSSATGKPPNSGARHSEGSRLDLSQRVMTPISRPTASALPDNIASVGAYGIHRILRTHQKGGMGRILVAYDQYLKRDVALKELHPEVAEDESIVRRFVGEAEITAQLEHPGIVPIHMLGLDREGLPYYTMKMIKGSTLQEAIKAYHRKPSQHELLNLVRRLVSVSKTIAFAHSKGVIHRDLKPANIMLGEHGETLVMDWGLAKPFSQAAEDSYVSVMHHRNEPRPELTMVGAIVGTPAFMSPEQASPEESFVGPLSDVFSLGTVLYYLLAGQTAFSGRSTQEVLAKVLAAAPSKPSEVNKKTPVPRGLEAICAKAMAKSLEERYQSAMEFVDDLCRWLDGEPISAEKNTITQKIVRYVGRYRALAISLPFLIVLVTSMFLLGMLVNKNKEEKNRQTLIASILNHKVDLTEYSMVTVEGTPGLEVSKEPCRTGGTLVTCHVTSVPLSKNGAIIFHAPSNAVWNLTKCKAFSFSLFENQPGQPDIISNFSIRLGCGSSYFEIRPKEELWSKRRRNSWYPFHVPLSASPDWTNTPFGTPTMSRIDWIEFHFTATKPITLNLDSVEFEPIDAK
jgi:serine/threonine protein kinase